MVRKAMDNGVQQELTKAELEMMQVIWDKEKVLVHDILDVLPEPKPAYNTVSTIVRILEQKGFVGHKAYGRTYEYYPLVSKEDYTQRYMTTVLDNFFDGSLSRLVSFFSRQESISASEQDEIIKMLKNK
jgi:predicted transcriptional regulator